MRRLVRFTLLAALMTSCSSESTPRAEPAVSALEASALLREVADRISEHTLEAAAHICTSLAESCDGLSSGWRQAPVSAPRTPPSVLCDVALPTTPTQAGARMLVVTGRDVSGRSYVGQVLVERRDGRPVVHEPAFWLGIRYTSLVRGRAWSVAGDPPRQRMTHETAVRRACSDPAGFVANVTRG